MRKFLLILSVLAVIALAVLNLAYDDRIPPDDVYPMANQNNLPVYCSTGRKQTQYIGGIKNDYV